MAPRTPPRRPRRLAAVLLVLVLALAPPALGHGNDHASHAGGDGDAVNGTSVWSGLDTYRGKPVWGEVRTLPTENHTARNPAISGPWVVWEAHDGQNIDILAYHLEEERLVRVTNGTLDNRDPDIHGSVVVWKEVHSGRLGRIKAMDLDTNRTWTFTRGSATGNPVVTSRYIAWQEHDGTSWDIRAYDLEEERTFDVANTTFQEVEPVVVGDVFFWRHREYKQWDIRMRDITVDAATYVTRDRDRETGLQAVGHRVAFLDSVPGTSLMEATFYDPSTDELNLVGYRTYPRQHVAYVGETVLFQEVYVQGNTFNFIHLPSGDTRQLHDGRFRFGSNFDVDGGRLVVPDLGREPGELVVVEYSPLALQEAPSIIIDAPKAGRIVVEDTVEVRGRVTTPGSWTPPREVLVSIDGGSTWSPAQGKGRWGYQFDTTNLSSGSHTVHVGAVYDIGPPVQSKVTITVVHPMDLSKDISSRLDASRVSLAAAIMNNLALLTFLVLALVALVLLGLRAYLRWAKRRPRPVEYVPPDDPEERIRRAGRVGSPRVDDRRREG